MFTKRLLIWAGVAIGLLGAVLIAVLAIAGYALYEHLSVDHQNLHALAGIAQYNLQQGKLEMPPAAAGSVAPAAPAVPPPSAPSAPPSAAPAPAGPLAKPPAAATPPAKP